MTLITSIRHEPGKSQLRIRHGYVVRRMDRHDSVNHTRHMTVVTAAALRVRAVARMFGKFSHRFVLPMTREARLVSPIIGGDFAPWISVVHRGTRQTFYPVLLFALYEARRAQDSLILVRGQARRTIRPESI